MNQNINLLRLHPYLRTKNDANEVMVVLEKLKDELFKETFTLSDVLTQNVPHEFAAGIQNLITELGINDKDRNSLQSFFTMIIENISSLPVVHIMLSVSPKAKLLEEIHEWFYQNFQKTVLLDISIDPGIIGGCTISFKGRANDYSLKNRIDQMS